MKIDANIEVDKNKKQTVRSRQKFKNGYKY